MDDEPVEPLLPDTVTPDMIDLALEANQETYDKCMEVEQEIRNDPVANASKVADWNAISMHWQKLRRVLFALARAHRRQTRKETENV